MKNKNIFLLIALFLLILIPSVLATVSFTNRVPPSLFQTTNQTIIFNITMNSTNINTTVNMTAWFFVTQLDNSTPNLNNSMANCVNNTVCNVTINGFLPGFYQWYILGQDLDGNTTSESFWFEILAAENDTLFRWSNVSGASVATLDKFLGNFWVLGNVTGSRFNGSLNTGTIIITDDIDDNHIEGDLNTYVDVAGDVMTGNLNSSGNVTLWNGTAPYGYFQGNGSYLTDVCFQNGTNCNDVFAWSALNNASPFLATQIVFGSNTAEATYANSFLWNGTHYQTPVNGSYLITIIANTNSSLVTEFILSLDVDGISFRNVSLTHSVINAVESHEFSYIGCIQRGDNISFSVDSITAATISLDNSSSLTIDRKSERCY